MELDNVPCGSVQIAHNFGAAAATGLPVAALRIKPPPRQMAWLILLAWIVQALSGVGFGPVSFFMEGERPQIHPITLDALCVKILCAALAVTPLAVHFICTKAAPGDTVWRSLTIQGVTAFWVGIEFGAISSVTRLPHHAARSMI